MRYIDADELKNFIFRYGDHATVDDCIKWIEQTETADVRENVKGEWIVKKDIINCSVCKRCSWSKSYEDLVRSFNFCPNCGADMRNSKLQYGDEDTLQGGLMSAT